MVEIWIGTKKVDYDGDIELQYSVSDIRELGSGNLNTSFDIDIPHTDNNTIILKAINNLSSIEEQNDNTAILLNDIEAISGELKLIEYDNNYTKAIVSADDWLEVYSNTKLSETDLSAYNEVYNSTNVVASWTASQGAFMRYPLVYWGLYDLFLIGVSPVRVMEATDFQAWFNVYKIIQNIFTGYSIESQFLASAYFQDLYISANLKPVDSIYKDDKTLEVKSEIGDNRTDTYFAAGVTGNIGMTEAFVLFDNIIENEYSYFNVTTEVFSVPEDGTYRFNWNVHANLFLDSATLNSHAYSLAIKRNSASVTTNLATATTTTSSSFISELDSSYVHLLAGDSVWCYASLTANVTGAPAGSTVVLRLMEDSIFKSMVTDRLLLPGLGKTIVPSECLPDWTQSDFIEAIKTQFNLNVWLDAWDKKIYIEPAFNADTSKSFYTNNVKDISSSIDYKDIEVELISQNYNKNIYLKYANDESDYLLREYNKTNILELGSKKITLESAYAKPGNQEIEVKFSTFIKDYPNKVIGELVPIIYGEYDRTLYNEPHDRIMGFNTKIGHWDGLVSGTWSYENISKTTYPLMNNIDFSVIYPTYFSKAFHIIDKGKLIKLMGIANILDIQEFSTVKADSTKEGFRPKYAFNYQNETHYGYINNASTDGKRFIYEIMLVK